MAAEAAATSAAAAAARDVALAAAIEATTQVHVGVAVRAAAKVAARAVAEAAIDRAVVQASQWDARMRDAEAVGLAVLGVAPATRRLELAAASGAPDPTRSLIGASTGALSEPSAAAASSAFEPLLHLADS